MKALEDFMKVHAGQVSPRKSSVSKKSSDSHSKSKEATRRIS
jgi:hypothetical protein